MGIFGSHKGEEATQSGSSVNQSALNLIMDQIKDLIEINTSLNKKYRDLESKVTGINSDVGGDKKEMHALSQKISDVQQNMEKFIGLYEVITNQFNPFVDNESNISNYTLDSDGNPVPQKLTSPALNQLPVGVAKDEEISVIPSQGEDNGIAGEEQNELIVQEESDHMEDSNAINNNSLNQVPVSEVKQQNINDIPNVANISSSVNHPNQSLHTVNTISYSDVDLDSIVPLTDLKGNVKSITTILSWMVYLRKQCGDSAGDILNYYTVIGWISPEVAKILSNYLTGLDVRLDQKSDGKMDVSDHIVSLFFIAKIKGVNLNAKTYRLISKIVKSKGFIVDED